MGAGGRCSSPSSAKASSSSSLFTFTFTFLFAFQLSRVHPHESHYGGRRPIIIALCCLAIIILLQERWAAYANLSLGALVSTWVLSSDHTHTKQHVCSVCAPTKKVEWHDNLARLAGPAAGPPLRALPRHLWIQNLVLIQVQLGGAKQSRTAKTASTAASNAACELSCTDLKRSRQLQMMQNDGRRSAGVQWQNF